MRSSWSITGLTDLSDVLEVDSSSPSGLRWKVPINRGIKAGDPAGTRVKGKYWKVQVRGKRYQVHRLVLLLSGQPCPGPGFVPDHRDGDRHNNKLANLRWVTESINASRKTVKNRHGLRYVFCKQGTANKYYYSFRLNKACFTGCGYTTPTEAHTAALAHRLELFWNP